jgi:L-ribulokinase
MPPKFALGVDYGTSSVRAIFVSLDDGRELGVGETTYAHGVEGVITDPRDPHLARQHPADYEASLVSATRAALVAASRERGFSAERVIGIGVDATASTPIPVDASCRALALDGRFCDDPAAMAWLWKDHTAHAEAEEITSLFAVECPEQLERVGGTCSSEWFFPKLLRLERTAPAVFAHMEDWVELGDWIVGRLTGCVEPAKLSRNVCAAGHKALFHERLGLPSAEVLARLSPELGRWYARRRYGSDRVLGGERRAGILSSEYATRLGLPAGIAIAAGGIDAHVGAIGAGIRPGRLVQVIGTSACDLAVHPVTNTPSITSIQGASGVVRDSILPGHWGIEAGQAAVGDLYAWFVREFGEPAGLGHRELTERAAALAPGESGLLALDWNNGNRSILGNPRLSGLLIGQTLSTRPWEVYRALIEATAFGARIIVDRLVEHGVRIDDVVCCGGIAEKNPLLLSIYSDVLDRPLGLARSQQTCALGSAMLGAVAAGRERGGFDTLDEARASMTGLRPETQRPDPGRVNTYGRLFPLYVALHDAFGGRAFGGRAFGGRAFGGRAAHSELSKVMAQLIEIRERARDAWE